MKSIKEYLPIFFDIEGELGYCTDLDQNNQFIMRYTSILSMYSYSSFKLIERIDSETAL